LPVVLSNEGSNGFVQELVAAGCGNDNLCETLQDVVANTNPGAGSTITPACLETLASLPSSSATFNAAISNPHRSDERHDALFSKLVREIRKDLGIRGTPAERRTSP